MSLPYVIKILVTNGDPDGVRVVEKSNWSGSGFVFARADLAEAVPHGLSSPGVYVLIGDDPDDEGGTALYVGEAEDVGKRLGNHLRDNAKEFWTWTVVFTSKDSTLNKAHIRYVESRLIALAARAGRVRLVNGTQPPPPPMSAGDSAEADGFLAEMLAIYPIVGVSAFDVPAPRESGKIQYRLTGPDTDARGEERSDGFFVFAGATGRIEETDSFSPSFSRSRRRLIDSGVLVEENGILRLVDDYLFSSPTAAAVMLLGRNTNGREMWKDSDGKSLREHQIEAADAASGGSDDDGDVP